MDTSAYLDNSDETASLYRQRAELQAEVARLREVLRHLVYECENGCNLTIFDVIDKEATPLLAESHPVTGSVTETARDEIDEELAQTQAELSVARATIARYRRVTAIAATILDVASHTHVANLHLCPHGNSASYPTHGWWCDGCFLELEDALAAIRTEEAQG